VGGVSGAENHAVSQNESPPVLPRPSSTSFSLSSRMSSGLALGGGTRRGAWFLPLFLIIVLLQMWVWSVWSCCQLTHGAAGARCDEVATKRPRDWVFFGGFFGESLWSVLNKAQSSDLVLLVERKKPESRHRAFRRHVCLRLHAQHFFGVSVALFNDHGMLGVYF
jgi:hypothetical protein